MIVTQNILDASVRKVNEKISVIVVEGEVTQTAEKDLMDAYEEAVSKKTRTIILNFTNLEYMNSSGIGLLVTLLVRANRHRQKMLACGLSEHYRQIFELTRLDEAIEIHDDEPSALAASGAQ